MADSSWGIGQAPSAIAGSAAAIRMQSRSRHLELSLTWLLQRKGRLVVLKLATYNCVIYRALCDKVAQVAHVERCALHAWLKRLFTIHLHQN